MTELTEHLDNLRALFRNRDFLEGKGLSNEVNIRIFCYDPKDEMTVRHFRVYESENNQQAYQRF